MAEKPTSPHTGILRKTTAADRGRVERPMLAQGICQKSGIRRGCG